MFCLFVSITGFAQVGKVITDVYGTFEIVVKVGEDAFVTISSSGEVLDTEINGSFYYNGSGKISSIGNNSFYYNGSGKLSSGNTSFVHSGVSFRVTGGN